MAGTIDASVRSRTDLWDVLVDTSARSITIAEHSRGKREWESACEETDGRSTSWGRTVEKVERLTGATWRWSVSLTRRVCLAAVWYATEDLRMGSVHKDVASLLMAAAQSRTDQEVIKALALKVCLSEGLTWS